MLRWYEPGASGKIGQRLIFLSDPVCVRCRCKDYNSPSTGADRFDFDGWTNPGKESPQRPQLLMRYREAINDDLTKGRRGIALAGVGLGVTTGFEVTARNTRV